MSMLTEDMKRVIDEQRLGFVATVCPDGTPNLSPKGTLACWDDDHLVFADIASPGTVENLRGNPTVEINVVDPISRKGYRFKGEASLHDKDDALFEELLAFFRQRGSRSPVERAVRVKITRAACLTSPLYDLGLGPAEVEDRWQARYDRLRERRLDRRDGAG